MLPSTDPGGILHRFPLYTYGFVPGLVVVGETHHSGSSNCRGLPETIRSDQEGRHLVRVLKPDRGQLLERGRVHLIGDWNMGISTHHPYPPCIGQWPCP